MFDPDGNGLPLSESSSRHLLSRARSGDDRAADRLFARYLPRLYRWAHGKLPSWARGALDTGDLVQDTLINAYQQLQRFEPRHDGALLGYLRRALRNRLVDHLRQAHRRPAQDLLTDDIVDAGDSPLASALQEQEREQYLLALQRLRPGDRQAIVARLELGYSYEQLAVVLRKPSPIAARLAVRRALLRLARVMENAQ